VEGKMIWIIKIALLVAGLTVTALSTHSHAQNAECIVTCLSDR
jgi:hypothetical protein